MPRSALIVDDSRTALAALSRLLKEQGIATDTVESGQEALNFLRSNSPSVIFLDHMMPGMDGFETLAALKANARTAAIPVVMYTSREGDAYMGQALVQGAFGVLQKPVNPQVLEQILRRVDQLRPPPAEATRGTSDPAASMPRAAVTGVIHVPPEFRARPGAPPDPASAARTGSNATESASARRRPGGLRPWWLYVRRALLVFVLLLPAVWYYERYQQAEQLRALAQRENLELRAEQRAARERAEAKENSQPFAAEFDTQQRNDQRETRGLLDTIAWALNQHGQYGFSDEPLNDARLAQLRELIARLTAAGFQGTVRLETHIGEYCLVRDEQGSLRVPSDGLSIGRCEVVTYPPAQAVQLGQRQSPAFARYLAERRPGNPIQITLVSHGASRPLATYPDPASAQTAGEWNQVARLNQRVEVRLLPAP